MGERLETVFEADFGDGGIGVAQLVKDAFFALLHHPFVSRFVEDGFKDAAKGGDAIAPQLCKLFYGLYLVVVLQHEVLKAAGVF